MPAELVLVDPPAELWRVERAEPALRFSQLSLVDATNDRAGNRFDVPGAGVLYGATHPEGGYAETLAGFRPRAALVRALSTMESDPGRVRPGEIDQEWLISRRLRSFETVSALPFVDVESPLTHTHLTRAAGDVLMQAGIENLDVAHIRGPSRRLVRPSPPGCTRGRMHREIRSTPASATCLAWVSSSAGRSSTAPRSNSGHRVRSTPSTIG
jgi:hypothetical protein